MLGCGKVYVSYLENKFYLGFVVCYELILTWHCSGDCSEGLNHLSVNLGCWSDFL